jgi:glycosyltransferase involved in cell wall biosynthesis
MRKLLLVTFHFPPCAASGTHRMLGFARHLPSYGWQPVVVAPPSMPLEPVDAGLLSRVPHQAAVFHAPYPLGPLTKPFRFLAPKAVWLPGAFKACARAIRQDRPDAVLTSGPPHCVHLVGLMLRRCYGLPWVADFRDPWITDRVAKPPSRVRYTLEAFWEKQVMRTADIIVANTPLACAGLCAAFPRQASKMVSITNGYDPEDFAGLPSPAAPNGTITVLHAGELYMGRDPRPFLDAVQGAVRELRQQRASLRVQFLGRTGASGCNLEQEIRQRALEQIVHLAGHVSHQATVQAMGQADILLLLDSPGRRIGVPAKLYEYVGAGRAVLALAEPEGDVGWVLKRSGLPHRVLPPSQPEQVRLNLVSLIAEIRGRQASAHPSVVQPLPFARAALTRDLVETISNRLSKTLSSHPGSIRPAALFSGLQPPLRLDCSSALL